MERKTKFHNIRKKFIKFYTNCNRFLEWIFLIPIKIRLYFHAKKCFKILKIKPIKIFYEYDSERCYYKETKIISLGQDRIFNVSDPNYKKSMYDIINWDVQGCFEKMAIALAHEIGHYYQNIKYPKWFDYHKKEYHNFQPYLFDENDIYKEYRKLKLEASADKIAVGLCKRLNIGKPKERISNA